MTLGRTVRWVEECGEVGYVGGASLRLREPVEGQIRQLDGNSALIGFGFISVYALWV